MGFLEEYERTVAFSGLKVKGRVLLAVAGLIALLGILLAVVLRDFLPLIVALVLADLVAMYPYYRGRRTIEEMEENLSEALRQMAAVLRSGGTFEVAVREIAISDYGALSKEFARMLKEMESGKSFIAALESMSLRVGSPFLERVTVILRDAIRTGGKVADVLDSIAEDIRKLYQIKKERRARTTMQFLFLAVSAAVLGPFLMGVAVGIINYMMVIGQQLVASGNLSPEEFLQKQAAARNLELVLTLFVIIESVLAGFMGAAIREGKLSYGAVLAPIFLLLAYVFFLAGKEIVFLLTG
ncbi:MAG: type II secretion system F family protein [Candidatus Diapherotrites archaeon]|nr:type II secretion system F family protein [Candidatus Diapherotrites archaeon]